MNRNIESNNGKKILSVICIVLAIALILPIMLISSTTDYAEAETVINDAERVQVRVAASLGYGRAAEFTKMDNTTYAYPDEDGAVVFDIILITNADKNGDQTKLADDKPITVGYYTFDMSAIASSGDYKATSGKVTFPGGSKHYTTIRIKTYVNTTDIGLYVCSASSASPDSNLNNCDYYPVDKKSGDDPSKSAYISRCFGMKIYIAEGDAEIYNAYIDNTTKYLDEAYAMISADTYIPCYNKSDGYEIAYYGVYKELSLSDITELRNATKTSEFNIKNTTFGSLVSNSIIQNDLGHYYFNGSFTINGKDVFQNDSYVGLVYDGWEYAEISGSVKTKFNSYNMGIACIEMDGFPDKETMDFGGYRNENYDGNDDDEKEYSEKSGIFEEYCTSVNNYYHAYRIQGDPDWVGMIAARDNKGDRRKVYDIKIGITVRDDTPVAVEDIFIENTYDENGKNYTIKQSTDKLRIMVRFNEPVQLNSGDKPYLKVQLKDTSTAKTVNALYERGAGSDTLVFYIDLSAEDVKYINKNVTTVRVSGICNCDSVNDFSGTEMIRKVDFDAGKSTAKDTAEWGIVSYDKNDITTKKEGRWTLRGFVAKDGTVKRLTLSLNQGTEEVYGFDGAYYDLKAKIDMRTPTISSVRSTTASSGASAKQHEVTISIDSGSTVANKSDLQMTLYYAWSDDIIDENGKELDINSVLSKPTEYTSYANKYEGDTYKVLGSKTGTRFLWLKAVSYFGITDEMVCGPFYFDNEADDVENIEITDQYSPSAKKQVKFTIDHTSDYRSYSRADNQVGLKKIGLLWATYSPWTSGEGLNFVSLYDANEPLGNNHVITVETVEKTCKQLKFNKVSANKEQICLNKFAAYDNEQIGNIKTIKYIVSTTYTIDIGYLNGYYDDFNLATDIYKKVYIGFVVWDGLGNYKNYLASNLTDVLTSGKDYKADVETYDKYYGNKLIDGGASFDIRDIIGTTSSSNTTSITSGFGNVNAYISNKTVTFTVKFDNPITASVFGNGTQLQIEVCKPNSTYESTTDFAGMDSKFVGSTMSDGKIYRGEKISDLSNMSYTPWLYWHVKKTTINTVEYVNEIEFVVYKYDETLHPDMYGYYNVSFNIISSSETKTTVPVEFYLGSDYESSVETNKNHTINYDNLTTGNVMVNKVYQLLLNTQYYYYDNGTINKTPYVKNGQLTFSSKEIAEEYIRYMEYKDLTLFYIKNQDTADSLDASSGTLVKATGETTPALVGQYWIRYKKAGWTTSSTSVTDWVYYYYSSGNRIDTASLSINLQNAIDSVVSRILINVTNESAKDKYVYTLLTSNGGLNASGAPYVNPTWLRFNSEHTSTNNMGEILDNASYGGDYGIYDSLINVSGRNYVLASTYVLQFSEHSVVYIMNIDDGSGRYFSIPLGASATLKNVVDQASALFNGSSTSTAASGRYKILEIDENGINAYYVYIDKDAPQLNFSYEIFTKVGDEYKTIVYEGKTSTSGSDIDHTINAASFTINGLGINGAIGSSRIEEIDSYAYFAIFNKSKTKLYYAYTMKEFGAGSLKLDPGTYLIEVYDRSGNNYTEYVNITANVMTVNMSGEDKLKIVINNRSSDEIKSFELKRDNVVVTTEFFNTKSFQENGTYTLSIVDIYGIEFFDTINYQRRTPDVIWRYEDNNQFLLINDKARQASLQTITFTKRQVITSTRVSFAFSSIEKIKVEFVNCTQGDFTIGSSGQNTTYTQKAKGSCSVIIYYEENSDTKVTYNIVLDENAPQITVSYEQYQFENREDIDIVLQVYEAQRDNRAYETGAIITPRRIDFATTEKVKIVIGKGSIVSTKKATLKLTDVSGISSFIIQLNDVTLYNGEYHADGIYIVTYKEKDPKTQKEVESTKEINFNELTEYGVYTITAYDSLLNKSVFTFKNINTTDVSCYVDGELYTPIVQYSYYKNGDKYVLENGEKVVEAEWSFLLNFKVVGDEENGIVILDKNSLENLIRNSQEYTCVQYGNESQAVRFNQDSFVHYLLTVNGKKYYAGFKYESGELYGYEYVANVMQDGGETLYSAYDRTTDLLLDTRNCGANVKYEIYYFNIPYDDEHSETLSITAWIDKNGYLNMSISAPQSQDLVVTVETKVVAFADGVEPAYYKTKLSQKQTSVVVTMDGIVLDLSGLKSKETYYTNGNVLDVLIDEEHLNEDVYSIRISYDAKVLNFEKYYYVYLDGGELPEGQEYFRIIENRKVYTVKGDGYYNLEVVNKYGNVKIYYFSVSNQLGVLTVITNRDNFTCQYDANYNDVIGSNNLITMTFRNDANITYKVYNSQNVETLAYELEESVASKTLLFTAAGDYRIVVEDGYHNVITKNISIRYSKTYDVPDNIIIGYDDSKPHRQAGYTNKKLSINSDMIAENGVKYISVKYGDTEKVVYNEISMTGYGRITLQDAVFTDCIGTPDNEGIYTIIFKDAYGNTSEKTIRFRQSSTLVLTRMTSALEKAEDCSIEKAMADGFWSNSSLMFKTVSNSYRFTVDGVETSCPKDLLFTNNVEAGTIDYQITYYDEYGNEYAFVAHLYRTVLSVEPVDTQAVVTIGNDKFITKNFTMQFSENSNCRYVLNGETFSYERGQILKKDGKYSFITEDVAGNVAYYTITKDSVVSYEFRQGINGDIVNKDFVITTSQVVFTATNDDTSYIKKAFLNGKAVTDYNNTFTKSGKWELVISDNVGNTTNFTFFIITHAINYFYYDIPQDYEFSDVWYSVEDSGRVSLNSLVEKNEQGVQHFEFKNDGDYIVVINSTITGKATSFTISITSEKPTAKISCEDGEETIRDIVISDTVAGDTIYIYKDGNLADVKEISRTGEEITISDAGDYKIVVKNLAGNESEYTFVRKRVPNTAGSILIILGIVAVAVGLFIGLLYRNKSKVDK